MTICRNSWACSKAHRLIDPDGVDVAGEGVADGPRDHVAFLVDLGGRFQLANAAHHHLPQPRQVGQIALQFLLVSIDAGGADDEAEARRRLQLVEDLAQAAARVFVCDLARHADAVEPGHQHEVAAGDADVGAQRRALGADAFLDDLNEHFLAALEDVLNERLGPALAEAAASARASAAIAAAVASAAIAAALATAPPRGRDRGCGTSPSSKSMSRMSSAKSSDSSAVSGSASPSDSSPASISVSSSPSINSSMSRSSMGADSDAGISAFTSSTSANSGSSLGGGIDSSNVSIGSAAGRAWLRSSRPLPRRSGSRSLPGSRRQNRCSRVRRCGARPIP